MAAAVVAPMMNACEPAAKRMKIDTGCTSIYRPQHLNTVEVEFKQEAKRYQAFRQILSSIHLQPKVEEDVNSKAVQLSSDHENIAGKPDAVRRLRNSLPALRQFREVYFDYENNHWLVEVDSVVSGYLPTINLPLRIGQCPVYTYDFSRVVLPRGLRTGIADFNPWEVCDDENAWEIAESFPESLGMRVNKWGHVDVLYESNQSLQKDLKRELPGTIADLSIAMAVIETSATSSRAPAGFQVASRPDEILNVLGCIGLRIRLSREDHDCWTTTTHAWMERPSRTASRIKDYLANAITVARRSRRLSSAWDYVRGCVAEGSVAQNILGTIVYLAGSRDKVGTISTCYDTLPLPDSKLQFPLGLDHDLSLITGDTLPEMETPPNVPQLEQHFAQPSEALKASDVFLTRHNIRFGKWTALSGHVVTGEAREALVVGMEYFWERRHTKVKRAIIWRTERDDYDLAGWSGTALCLGKPSARTCRALVFQNYQSYIKGNTFFSLDTVRDKLEGTKGLSTFKAGFVLPDEVQDAEIIIQRQPELQRRSTSTSTPKSATSPSASLIESSAQGEKRTISGPF
ncbi:MAG: hypothetical protein M1825_005147 [Sarcosagium campestre]|nr:MAG: hypothetical protein M1825_005147 [Sarcosagium campestre]